MQGSGSPGRNALPPAPASNAASGQAGGAGRLQKLGVQKGSVVIARVTITRIFTRIKEQNKQTINSVSISMSNMTARIVMIMVRRGSVAAEQPFAAIPET